jgi:hypothetical protein
MTPPTNIGGIEPSRDTDAPAAPSSDVAAEGPKAGAAPPRRPTVEEMGEWSFPASDPPATWTWEPRSP